MLRPCPAPEMGGAAAHGGSGFKEMARRPKEEAPPSSVFLCLVEAMGARDAATNGLRALAPLSSSSRHMRHKRSFGSTVRLGFQCP